MYLQNINLLLSEQQRKTLEEMDFTVEVISNINIATEFGELCKSLNITKFATKMKIKTEIINLQQNEKIIYAPTTASTPVPSNPTSIASEPSLICTPISPASISPQKPNIQNPFDTISEADDFMHSKLNTNEPFVQHSILKDVYDIPMCNGSKQQQTTLDSVEAIRDMQLQYSEKRLCEVPQQKLISEWTLRRNIILAERKIKKVWFHINESMKKEIKFDCLLRQCTDKIDKHKSRKKNHIQHTIHTLIKEAKQLKNEINEAVIQIETYTVNRQFIRKVNDEYLVEVNPWRRKVTDSKVTNFFISSLNTLQTIANNITKLLTDFELHIGSRKYTNKIGCLKQIENGYEIHIKNKEERQKKRQNIAAIQKYFGSDKLEKKIITTALTANNNDITEAINYLQKNEHINIQKDSKTIVSEIQSIKVKPQQTAKPINKKKLKNKSKEKGNQSITTYFGSTKKNRKRKNPCQMKPKNANRKQRRLSVTAYFSSKIQLN